MKLLFVIPEYPPHFGGGISTYYQHLLPVLANQGHRVDVLVANPFAPSFAPYESDGVSVSCLAPEILNRNLPQFSHYRAIPELQRYLATAWSAWEQMADQPYDLIETTDWGLLFLPWVVMTEGLPIVVQLHGSVGQIDTYDPRQGYELQGHLIRLLEQLGLALATGLMTHSRANGAAWSALTGRAVLNLPPAWTPPDLPEAVLQPSDRGLVVGRIQSWKGPMVLCEALRMLGNQAPGLDWVGRDMPYQSPQQTMGAYLKENYPDIWGEKIRGLGVRSQTQVAQLQAAASFVVVPSRWDVFNYTCAEAMAQGKLVICSDGAGAVDLIDHGVNGFTFPANDAAALAELLHTCATLPNATRQQIGLAAQKTIANVLNPLVVAQQRQKMYETVLAEGPSRKPASDWLRQAISPTDPLADPFALLHQLPLKDLASHTLQRLWAKIPILPRLTNKLP